ncbi:MAG: HflX GTPase family protein [Christensenellales bacterium]
MPTIALVGYTNAGKSTLLNQISGADALAEDKLFATLDPLTRRANLDGQEVLLTDTVGFVQKLPHELVDAFRSTLEEAVHADLLLHVVDSAHPEKERQIEVVDEVLHQLTAHTIPRLLVYNKADVSGFARQRVLWQSAPKRTGLKRCIGRYGKLSNPGGRGALIPYAKGSAGIDSTYGTVESEEYLPEGTSISCRLPAERAKQIQKQLS